MLLAAEIEADHETCQARRAQPSAALRGSHCARRCARLGSSWKIKVNSIVDMTHADGEVDGGHRERLVLPTEILARGGSERVEGERDQQQEGDHGDHRKAQQPRDQEGDYAGITRRRRAPDGVQNPPAVRRRRRLQSLQRSQFRLRCRSGLVPGCWRWPGSLPRIRRRRDRSARRTGPGPRSGPHRRRTPIPPIAMTISSTGAREKIA